MVGGEPVQDDIAVLVFRRQLSRRW